MTIATEEGSLRRGAVRPGERALAPDLARGIMLLAIVLSNTAFHLWAARRGPPDGSPWTAPGSTTPSSSP
jgi:uncharacterized membrane protein YeiB